MALDPSDLSTLSHLLDQAFDLEPTGVEAWLGRLPAEQQRLVPVLRKMLARHVAGEQDSFLVGGPMVDDTAGDANGDSGFQADGSGTRIRSREQSALVGQRLGGVYSLVAPLGRGGTGSVWRARRDDGRFEGEAAIKLLHLSLLGRAGAQRFRREGAILARLTHPHIARLMDAGISDAGQPYLVLELVDGERIDRYCDAQRLTVEQRLKLFDDVLSAVAHAHSHLVIHRDIKPTNILVAKDGSVKLLDFGIAKLLEDETQAGESTEITREGGSPLTPEYAAPEQLRGEPVTTATDVYALGVLLYQLLAGGHPTAAEGASMPQLVRATLDTEPARLSGAWKTGGDGDAFVRVAAERSASPAALARLLSGDLENIVSRALRKEPSERYPTIGALAEDLRRYLAHEPVSARSDSLAYRTAKFVRRYRLAVGLSALVVLSLCVGLAASVWQAERATRARMVAERMLGRIDAANTFSMLLLSRVADAGHPMSLDDIIASGEKIANQRNGADPSMQAYELLVLLGFYVSAQEPEKTKGLAEKALALALQAGDRPLTAMAQCYIASKLAQTGEGAAGDALAARALPLADGDPEALATCWEERSSIAQERGDDAQWLEYAQRALDVLGPLSVTSVKLGLLQSHVAAAYSMLGRYVDADASFRRSVETFRAAGALDSLEASATYSNWGAVASAAGQPLLALERLRRAIQIDISINGADSVAPRKLINELQVLTELHMLDDASSIADQVLRRARESGDMQAVIYVELGQARVRRLQGRLADANTLLAAARREVDALRPAPGRVKQRLEIEQAALDRAEGRPEAALARLDALRDALPPHGAADKPNPGAQTVLAERAETLAALGRTEPALVDAREALALARALQRDAPSSAKTGKALLTLAKLQLATGAHDDAIASAREAAKQLEDSVGPKHPDTVAAVALASR